MKKILPLFCLALFSMITETVKANIIFSVSPYNNYPIKVSIDGRVYTSEITGGTGEFIVYNLAAGSHSLIIYGAHNAASNAVVEMPLRIRELWRGTLTLAENYHTDVQINRFGKIFTDNFLLTGNTGTQPSGPDAGQAGGNGAIASADFTLLKQAIKNEYYEANMLTMLRQVATNNYFTVAQVKEILGIFYYEAGKLTAAKLLYKRTVDKGNYFQVNDSFYYSASKSELSNYILQNP